VAAVLVVALVGWTVLHRSWFSAKTIVVHGATHETPVAVIEAAGLSTHPPLISISTGAAVAGVERLAWVKMAEVSKHWPSTVDITVVDRTPVGTVADGSRWLLVDETGRILDISSQRPYLALQTIVPVPKAAAVGGELGEAAEPALLVAATLPPAFRAQVNAVIGHPDGTVTLQLTTPVSVALGTATELPEKYEDIASVIAGATLHAGDVLDVSVPQASTITGP
jgi:cell division protein FtsQ